MSNVGEIEAEMSRAELSLQAAELLCKNGLLADSLSRSYYAILHAARAALLTQSVRVSSHEAVKRLFGMHLVKTGLLSADLAASIRREQDDRFLADYDVMFEPGRRQTEERVREARVFLRRIEDFIATTETSVDRENSFDTD